MIRDIRNSKNLKTYLEQLEEVKARIHFVSSYSNLSANRFEIETHALQIRKIIELMSFALLAIHREEYSNYREKAGIDFKSDWNGRDIIYNILKLNPDMFFKPINPEHREHSIGFNQLKLRDEKECYTLKKISKIYDGCGGILHIENPWKRTNKIDQFHSELPSIIKKLKNTLEAHAVMVNHWVQK